MSEPQGIDDQYVYTCCAAQHNGRECVLFGYRIDDDGKQWARNGFAQDVPLEEVAVYSRKAAGETPPPYNFRDSYDKLPDIAKDAVMEQIHKALKWRGWDASGGVPAGLHARAAIVEIGKIFAANGMEIGEYT